MSLVIGSWSNGKENLGTGWEMLAKVHISFLQPWLQCKTEQKKKKSLKWDLWVIHCCRGDKSGAQPGGLQELSWSSISARFWWDTSRCCCGALQNPPGSCAWVPNSSGFCPGGAAFLPPAQKAGETRLCRVPSRPLFHFKATRTRVLLCLSWLPIITSRVCFVVCFHSYFQCTFREEKKKSCFLLSQDSSCWEDVIRAIVTGCTKARDKVRPRVFPSEMSD